MICYVGGLNTCLGLGVVMCNVRVRGVNNIFDIEGCNM